MPEVISESFTSMLITLLPIIWENSCCCVNRLTGGARGKPNQEEAFLLWKREKDKLLKQKKIEQKIQKEATKPDNEKKGSTEIVG